MKALFLIFSMIFILLGSGNVFAQSNIAYSLSFTEATGIGNTDGGGIARGFSIPTIKDTDNGIRCFSASIIKNRNISFQFYPIHEKVEITIKNSHGAIIQKRFVNMYITPQVNIDIPHLLKGDYIIEVEYSNQKMKSSFTID